MYQIIEGAVSVIVAILHFSCRLQEELAESPSIERFKGSIIPRTIRTNHPKIDGPKGHDPIAEDIPGIVGA